MVVLLFSSVFLFCFAYFYFLLRVVNKVVDDEDDDVVVVMDAALVAMAAVVAVVLPLGATPLDDFLMLRLRPATFGFGDMETSNCAGVARLYGSNAAALLGLFLSPP